VPERAIGIFDSGVGGLTLLKEVARLLPFEDLLYVGDTARVPYGTKSPETVRRYALESAGFLVRQGVKMLVVACNTASAVAVDDLASRFQIPVIGVIEPGSRRAATLTRNRKIGVIGTDGTIKSGAYTAAIRSKSPDINVVSTACPLFVPLAEEGWSDHQIADIAAREYLAPLIAAGVDTLVLGCTHYPLLKKTLRTVLGDEIALVDSAEETAKVVVETLLTVGANRSGEGLNRFFVTDVPDRFKRVGSAFLGRNLEHVEQVVLKPS
jgi:glutamate racemase